MRVIFLNLENNLHISIVVEECLSGSWRARALQFEREMFFALCLCLRVFFVDGSMRGESILLSAEEVTHNL